ncbi:MAG: ATP synthase F1 subunit epsilon [Polyangiaceae bacterium]|nr:ATP synthase F1 subunit epsilon [Polyangiaceae bacterium]
MAIPQTLTLEVATPTGLALSVEAESVQTQSVNGELGVLPGHLPILVATRAGLLKYRVGGKDKVAAIGSGFAEAGPTKVLVLADAFVAPESIDRAAVKVELEAAEKALKETKEPRDSHVFQELQLALDWANAKLAAAGEG